MGAEAGCVLPGLILGVRMGARTVWTSSTPSLSGNAGGGGSGAGQNPIRAARFSILCLPRSIRSWSSSCWQLDTTACSHCVAVSSATIWASCSPAAVPPCGLLGFGTTLNEPWQAWHRRPCPATYTILPFCTISKQTNRLVASSVVQ